MRPLVVLVGAPGAGKTTVGRALADRWGVSFRDTDADVEALAHRTIAEIFVQQGEPAFRELEHQAVAAALTDHDGVLALGGGAVLHPDTRRQLAGQQVLWLRVSLADAASRVGMNTARPLLLGNVRAQLGSMLAERSAWYAEVATAVVDTDGRTPDEVVDAAVAALDPAVRR
ncbi:MAG: shikimate kinase [Actinomycetota bacterium]|nr:MAG: shikimate kinase [Actinomycetota bacterium]